MKIILDGSEVKCHDFHSLEAGDVFQYVDTGQTGIKTDRQQVFNVCANCIESYSGYPIVPFLDAELVLDPSES